MHFFGDPGNENRSTVPVVRRFPARARNAYNILILYILSLFGGGGVAYFRKRNSARKIHSGKMSVEGPQSASSARVVDKIIRRRSAPRFGGTGFPHDDLTNRSHRPRGAAFGDIRRINSDLPFTRACRRRLAHTSGLDDVVAS